MNVPKKMFLLVISSCLLIFFFKYKKTNICPNMRLVGPIDLGYGLLAYDK